MAQRTKGAIDVGGGGLSGKRGAAAVAGRDHATYDGGLNGIRSRGRAAPTDGRTQLWTVSIGSWRRARLPTTATSSFGSVGFDRYIWNPAARMLTRSPILA